MRDDDGVYIGTSEMCVHWQGIDRIEEKTCCGGRVVKIAFVKCAKQGVVHADTVCICGPFGCSKLTLKQPG